MDKNIPKEAIFSSSKGYIIEEKKEKRIKVFEFTCANYDGIIDSAVNETWYNYGSGLYQSWTGSGNYYADYFEKYKNRETALKAAKSRIGM